MPATPTKEQLMRALLLDNNNVGGWTGGGGAADHSRATAWAKFLKTQMGQLLANNPEAQKAMFEQQRNGGGFGMQYGKMPAEADLKRWLDKAMGGSQQPAAAPQQQQLATSAQATGSLSGQRPGAQPGGMGGIGGDQLAALIALSAMNDEEARNAAVKKRETEIRGGMDDLYGRVMGRVENYNKAEAQRVEDQTRDAIRSSEARNAQRGLSNATIDGAYAMRAERDKNFRLQDLSEDTDERAIRHDMALTGDKNAFVERITDRGPDMSQIISLMQGLGQNGGGLFGGGGNTGQRGVDTSAALGQLQGLTGTQPTQGPQMTPWGAVQAASPYGGLFRQPIPLNPMLNPSNPLAAVGMQQAAVGRFTPQRQATGSNAYPTKPTRFDQMDPEQQWQQLQAMASRTRATAQKNSQSRAKRFTAEAKQNPWLSRY